ncbi:hypothetical protein DFH09DRAFT_1070411 [Mycena vulgaris]|nr:hypothetical protein DFH09DRAFT_1070411 [Mycena vulgaris]
MHIRCQELGHNETGRPIERSGWRIEYLPPGRCWRKQWAQANQENPKIRVAVLLGNIVGGPKHFNRLQPWDPSQIEDQKAGDKPVRTEREGSEYSTPDLFSHLAAGWTSTLRIQLRRGFAEARRVPAEAQVLNYGNIRGVNGHTNEQAGRETRDENGN